MLQGYMGYNLSSPRAGLVSILWEESGMDLNSPAPQKAKGLSDGLDLQLAAAFCYLAGVGRRCIQFLDLGKAHKDNVHCILFYEIGSECRPVLFGRLGVLCSCGLREHVVGECHFLKSCGRKKDMETIVVARDVWRVDLNALCVDNSNHSLGSGIEKMDSELSLESRLSLS